MQRRSLRLEQSSGSTSEKAWRLRAERGLDTSAEEEDEEDSVTEARLVVGAHPGLDGPVAAAGGPGRPNVAAGGAAGTPLIGRGGGPAAAAAAAASGGKADEDGAVRGECGYRGGAAGCAAWGAAWIVGAVVAVLVLGVGLPAALGVPPDAGSAVAVGWLGPATMLVAVLFGAGYAASHWDHMPCAVDDEGGGDNDDDDGVPQQDDGAPAMRANPLARPDNRPSTP